MQRTPFSRFFARRQPIVPVHGTQNGSKGDVGQDLDTRASLSRSGVRKCRHIPRPLWERALAEREIAALVAASGQDAIVPTPSGKFEVWRAGDPTPLGSFERESMAQAVMQGLKRARGDR